jgi:stealth protein CR2
LDILYTLGGGSPWQDNELRYSLRSIEKHLTNYRDVYIVGKHRPAWLTNVIYVDCEDKLPYFKEQNIFHKVCRGCESSVSDEFLFFNDDHFLLQDFDAETFPFFYKCSLDHSLWGNGRVWHGKYKRALEATFDELTSRHLPVLNYDTHTPIIYNKQKMLQLRSLYDWSKVDVGYVLKSLYGNTHGVQGVHEYDCKIDDIVSRDMVWDQIRGKKVFSIANIVLQPTPDELQSVLDALYPMPSKYEQ